ncbi:MAG: Do family serine endopeptidase [Candidatus Krumholzibacteria bacterium]|nr:Do family serine endopeptidase [Candidatus Krumholzibacteria bacterium]
MDNYAKSIVMTSFRKSLKLFLAGAAIFLGGFLFNLMVSSDIASSPQRAAVESQSEVIPEAGGIHSAFTSVAAKVRPAVVYIKTQRAVSRERREERFGPFDFFREMPEGDNPRRVRGGGSGFIIDEEGRILTNHHVIRDAERIIVVLGDSPDEEEYEAEIVGHDVHTDIAVIKIDADRDLPVVRLGNSEEMQVGDWVMAIGTPFGELAGTVTVGVVSAKGRNDLRIFSSQADYQNYIQTDASINFGNSGGPLVNLRGEAIGINTAINPSGQGIGFAIPINMAKNISAQLIEKGRVQYGFMGIRLQELNKEIAQGRGLDIERGILVTEVLAGEPAEKAGLQQGDVIVEFDNKPVRDGQRFRLMVGKTAVGTRVPLKVLRDGKTKSLTITLAERRPPEEVVASAPRGDGSWLGLQVDDARSEEAKDRFGISGDEEGVVVIDVEDGSPASEAGIRQGDVITEVYSHKVDNLKQYVEISRKLKDRRDPIAFLVKRRGMSTYVPVIPKSN